jgi:hypothetical protein
MTGRGAGWAVLVGALALAGCNTTRLTEPPQTATEELLVSTAVDRAVEQLHPALPPGSKVFVDPQYFTDAALYQKYAVGAVRDQLLRRGAHLVDDRKTADVVVEMRSGAQSIDHHTLIIGIPGFPIPIPFAGTFNFPQIAFYGRDRQTGVAKIAITSLGTKDGALVDTSGPTYAVSDKTDYTLLLFITWTESDLAPEAIKEKDK